jgi:protein PhnA
MHDELYVCPDCAHEWNPLQQEESSNPKILDSNGKELQDGDSVIVIKDLPVKGAPKPIKAGTKVKNIRLNHFAIIISIAKLMISDQWL